MKVISIDPGQQKCGVLLADLTKLRVVFGKIVEKEKVISLIRSWIENYSIECILLGNGTTSKFWESELIANKIDPVKLVNESHTTLRAKERYFQLCPPRFIFSLFPKALILPPKNLDAVVALILVEDYFQKRLEWQSPIEIKISP